jgi:hypothetical protein
VSARARAHACVAYVKTIPHVSIAHMYVAFPHQMRNWTGAQDPWAGDAFCASHLLYFTSYFIDLYDENTQLDLLREFR